MNLLSALYVGLLFFVLTPGILVSLPPKGTKYAVAAFHSIVFALVFHFTHPFVSKLTRGFQEEGFNCPYGHKTSDPKSPCAPKPHHY
jgi:hypothetical protein